MNAGVIPSIGQVQEQESQKIQDLRKIISDQQNDFTKKLIQNNLIVPSEEIIELSGLETFEEKLNFIRNKRDKLINETMWVKEKYECQLREKQIGMTTATDIPQKQYEEWLQYWKNLRNLPNRMICFELDIDNFEWPQKPTKG